MNFPPHLDTRSFPPKTALVVGPDHTVAATVATILPDWTIERVRDNVAALTLIEARPFDVVLTGATRQAMPMSICSARSDWSGHILDLSFSPTKARRRMLSPPCASRLLATSR